MTTGTASARVSRPAGEPRRPEVEKRPTTPWAVVRRLFARIPARVHISTGLASLVSTALLGASMLGFVPDTHTQTLSHRSTLSESIAASASMLLRRGDMAGLRTALDVIVTREASLDHMELHRLWDDSVVTITANDGPATGTAKTGVQGGATVASGEQHRVKVPLYRAGREWGALVFVFRDPAPTWLDQVRQPPFGLIGFVSVLCFLMFYVYLRRVLKELDPSAAVPDRVRSTLDTIAESILVIDRKRDIVLANAAFGELLGVDPASLVGRAIQGLDWEHGDATTPDTPPWDVAVESLQTTRNDMLALYDGDGRLRKFIVNCSPILAGNEQVNGVLISLDDVTVLEEKEALLRESMHAAEAANEAKSAFLSSMSHEIRTPMTAILGFTDVLRRTGHATEEARQRYLATIHNSGQHLLGLINDVLDLSKVESGAMEVERIRYSPARIAHEVVQVLGVKAREKGIGLELQVHSNLPEWIEGDPSRLRQIVTNLAGNAIKFTETGTVTIALVSESDDETSMPYRLHVRDTGIGMTSRQLETIFDAFTQADASINRRFGGTGLGLSISKKLAIAMGGEVSVSSEPDVGSCFTVHLPTGANDSAAILSPAEVLAALDELDDTTVTEWRMPSARVLVVDDGAENRELLEVVLGELGLDVTCATNGREGLDRATGAESPFDVVLMDIQMPVMDGYEAVAEMRGRGVDGPIVALTANAMKGYEARILEAGFSHYMTKPIDLDALTALLARLLGGEAVDSEAVATTREASPPRQATEDDDKVVPLKAKVSSKEADPARITSRLVARDPRFAPLAARFITELKGALPDLEQAAEQGDHERLADRAHWLKGSAGTVGFDPLTRPAKELERAALAENDAEVAAAVLTIAGLCERLSVDEPQAVEVPEAANAVTDSDPVDTVGITAADSPVSSTLPLDHPRFRDIVDRFMPRLEQQLDAMRDAAERGELDTVADLAHWLKGSGGNVGFGGFTTLARDLERAARDDDADATRAALTAVLAYGVRVRTGWQQLPDLKKSA